MAERDVMFKGLRELRRLLRPIDELVAAPWSKAISELTEDAARAAQAAAPVRSGRLKSKIYARQQKRPMPMWGAVRSRAKGRSKGGRRTYDYPRLLEFSPRHHHQGEFTRAVSGRWGSRAEDRLAKAATDIARKWGRG